MPSILVAMGDSIEVERNGRRRHILGIRASSISMYLMTMTGHLAARSKAKTSRDQPVLPAAVVVCASTQVKFYDLGGGTKIRAIWDNYYHDAHGLVYVVDGADAERWQETRELFAAATVHKYLAGKVRAFRCLNLAV